jgi:hypothetical protein
MKDTARDVEFLSFFLSLSLSLSLTLSLFLCLLSMFALSICSFVNFDTWKPRVNHLKTIHITNTKKN